MPGTQPTPEIDTASQNFERFRVTGAPEALTAVFDDVGGELLSLASHLATDAGSAEDLVQECFLIAIRKARRWDPSRPVLPWLVGILLREARRLRRRAARTIDTERLPRANPPDGARVAMHADTLAAVEVAVADLPAAYREIVRAATIDGEKPREIARRLGRAPGTVRVQLHRGLDLLRRALPVGLSVGAAIGTTPRGMAQVRAVLEVEARMQGPALAAGSSALPTASLPSIKFLGAMLMGAKTLSVIAAGTLLVGGIFLMNREGQRSGAPGTAPAAQEPAPKVAELEPLNTVRPDHGTRVTAPAASTPAPPPTEELTAPVAAPRTCTATGRVLPPDGTSLGTPWVGFLEGGRHSSGHTPQLPTGKFEGGDTFEITLDVGAKGILLYADQTGRVGRREWTVPAAATFELGELLLEQGVSISGTAWALGAPLKAGQFVLAQADYDPTPAALILQRVQLSGGAFVRGSAAAVVEDGGAFRFEGLEPGVRYRLVAVPPRDGTSVEPSLMIAATAGLPTIAPASGVRLESGVVAVTLVVQSEGKPVAAASLVQKLTPDDPRNQLPAGLRVGLMGRTGQGSPSAVPGEVPVQLIEGAPVHAEVSALGYATKSLVLDPNALLSGARVTVELERDAHTATVIVGVSGPDAMDLAGFQGVLFGYDKEFKQLRLGPVPIEDGKARFQDVGVGLRNAKFFLAPPDLGGLTDLPYFRVVGATLGVNGLAPGETRTIEVQATVGGRVELNLTGRVPMKPAQFEIVEASGNVVRPPLYVRDGNGHQQTVGITSDGPIYMGMSLPAGKYTLRQSGPNYAAGEIEVALAPGQSTPVAFHLEPR